jgi:uncharacterized protein (DUF305 family)
VWKKPFAAIALVLVGALTLAACGDDSMDGMEHGSGPTAMTSSTPSGDVAGDFNDADVTFATDMIPHHRQAVEMAELAETRADAAEVKELATKIKGAQDPEIQVMSGWLTAWGKPVPDRMGGHDMNGSMPGMMSSDDMDALMDAAGADFDQMFLTMMIPHHQGAVEMAPNRTVRRLEPRCHRSRRTDRVRPD